ncbi:MAG: DUF1893 domain-containing protein [Oscillospiraceae bacterium]
MIERARELIKRDGVSVAAVTPNRLEFCENGSSVRPLYRLYCAHKDELRGCAVADKVIGKAAACILVEAGAASVFAYIMSEAAKELLTKNNIKAEYEKLVEYIENRDKTDMCPMEKTVLDCEDTSLAVSKISEFIQKSAYSAK